MAAIKEHILPNTKLIYLESPGSVDFKVVDLRAVAKLAKSLGVITAVDNTYLTPLFQKPLELGIDITIHSCSKYICGHADVLAGAVITSNKLMQPINDYCFKLNGAVPSPHDSALLLRGLRTLPTRLEAGLELTEKVVEFLQNHPKVVKVNHPLAYSQTDKLIFMSQATGYTSLLSFEIMATSFTDVARFVDRLRTFHIGVSWGGYENLVVTPNLAHKYTDVIARGDKPNLIRLALGLFAAATIIEDLEQALV
jgi:cystathionine beta-lyase/cystathionine gamma-synthase